MNPQNHTPGPWGVHQSYIYAPDGQIIAQVSNPGSKESDYPLVANRDLMAAAPDLLEALKQLEEGLANENEHGLWDADYLLDEIIRPAIAKAEGRAE